MKKYSASGYLIGAIFALTISGLYSMQAWPLFIKLFIPFPNIKQTTVYEGRLHIKGQAHINSKFGLVAPTYYVVDDKGERHKIFWGLLGSENEKYTQVFEGIGIKVWFNGFYGVIQEQSTPTPLLLEKYPFLSKTPTFGTKYQDIKSYTDKNFDWGKYIWRFLPSAISFLFGLYYLFKYLSTRTKKQKMVTI